MRVTALFPALCCTVALVLAFLCLFAGHKEAFMEDYHLLTLNTSTIGQIALDRNLPTSSSSNPLTDALDTLQDLGSTAYNSAVGQATAALGIQDFYSFHLLTYCAGQYAPAATPNATLAARDISKNVTRCSETRAMRSWDLTAIVDAALTASGTGVTLDDLDWPQDLARQIDALAPLLSAMFALYVLAIVCAFLALCAAAAGLLRAGARAAAANVLVAGLAFVAGGVASALATAVAVLAARYVDDLGAEIGLRASWGAKFLALTWAATALLLLAVLAWVGEFCVRRRARQQRFVKEG